MIEQNVENEARPEAARPEGSMPMAERKNEPLVPGIWAPRCCVRGWAPRHFWDLEIDLALYSPGSCPPY